MMRGGESNILVRLMADNSQFMDSMRAAQHATYDSVRAIKALNITAGGDLNRILSSTIRNTLSFAVGAAKAVMSDALNAIAFEENNQMALAALSEYRLKQEAINGLTSQQIQIGTRVLTVQEQIAALDKRRASMIASNDATLDQRKQLLIIKDLGTDIGQIQQRIKNAQEKINNATSKMSEGTKESLRQQIIEWEEKIERIQKVDIPMAQRKLDKLGYRPEDNNPDQVDWEAMAAQIVKGGDRVVGVFAKQSQGLTQKNIEEIKKQADMEARATMDVLSTIAIKSPFSRKEIIESYGTLVRMGGLSFKQGNELIQQITDIQAVTGKGNKGIQSMSLAVGKVLATGRLNGDAVNQLVKTAGIPVWEILAQSTGKQVQELQKMMRANKLTADIVMPALQGYMKEFAGKAAEEAGTFVGIINSFQDIKDTILVDFFKPIGDSLKRPLVDIIDMLTGSSLRGAIRQAGADIAMNLGKSIDFLYRSIDKFKKMGTIDGNPFTRIMVILQDAGKEFNFDASKLIDFVTKIEKVFNWVFINKDAIIAAGGYIASFFTTLVTITSVASVLGKIQMFITGFLASPIGLVAAAIAGIYLAWKYNVGGIRDWLAQNGPKILEFFTSMYDKVSRFINLIPYIDLDKFLGNLGSKGLLDTGIIRGINNIISGFEKIKNVIEKVSTGDYSFKDVATGLQSGMDSVVGGIFDDILDPKRIGVAVNKIFTAIADFFDPTKSSVMGATAGIFYSIGKFLNGVVNWIIDGISSILATANLDQIYKAFVGFLGTLVAGIAGLMAGFFEGDNGTGGFNADIGNTITLWFFKLLSTGVGAVLNLAVQLIYDIIYGIVGLFYVGLTDPKAVADPRVKEGGNDFAKRFLEEGIVQPFKNAFAGGRAEQIVKSLWQWMLYLDGRLREFLLNLGQSFALKAYDTVRDIDLGIRRLYTSAQKSIGEGVIRLLTPAGVDNTGLIERMNANIDATVTTVEQNYARGRENILQAQANEKKWITDNYGYPMPDLPPPPVFLEPPKVVPLPPKTGDTGTKAIETQVDGWLDAAYKSINDRYRVERKEVSVYWAPVPEVVEPVKPLLSAFEEYLVGGAFTLPIPIKLEPVLPETGADLSTPFWGTIEERAINQLFSAGNNNLGEQTAREVEKQIIRGVERGVTNANNNVNPPGIAPEASQGYQIGYPQGKAISDGFKAGVDPINSTIQGINTSIVQISSATVPQLTKSMDTFTTQMTSDVAPKLATISTSVVDPLSKAFDGVAGAVRRLNEMLFTLSERLKNIKIPDQLQSHSPTPFEMGLRGIAKTTTMLNRQKLPSIFSASPTMPDEEQRQRRVSRGSIDSQGTSINLTVKVGEKEVAGVVATAVAGEIKKMIYKDSLRG